TLQGHTDLIWSLSFSPDGRTLATASWDGTVKLWEVASGRERATLRGHTGPVWSVTFLPDGRTLASGGKDGLVRLWDLPTGKEKAALKGHRGIVYCLACSPDGRFLASVGGQPGDEGYAEAKLWEVSTGKVKDLKGHTKFINTVAF